MNRIMTGLKKLFRFRPLMATLGVMFLVVASPEHSWDGLIDRVIQFIFAYIAFSFAFSSDKD